MIPNKLEVTICDLKPEQAAVRAPVFKVSAAVVGPLIILDSIIDQLGLRVSRSSELPRQPLAERSMNLSTHCAPIKQP